MQDDYRMKQVEQRLGNLEEMLYKLVSSLIGISERTEILKKISEQSCAYLKATKEKLDDIRDS
jgi:hypothetical protein